MRLFAERQRQGNQPELVKVKAGATKRAKLPVHVHPPSTAAQCLLHL